MEVPATQVSGDTVTLFLNRNFTVKSVKGSHVARFTVETSNKVPLWNKLTVKFKSSPKNSKRSIRIEYSGAIDRGGQHGNFITLDQIHLSIDSAWHPIFSDLSTPIQGRVTVELGDNWKVLGPGKVTRGLNKYHVTNIKPAIDVSLYAAKKTAIIYKDGFNVIHDNSAPKIAARVSSVGRHCFQRMSQRFRKKPLLNTVQTILLKRSGPSFARGNYISLNSQNLGTKVETHQYLCHELAHNWTSYTSAMSHDYWMVESFAEYISAREIKRTYGEAEFNNIVKKWQALAEDEAFVWRTDYDRRASHKVNYGLGPIVLMKLHEKLGEKAFNELVDWYMTSSVTETEELIAKVASFTDSNTGRWFKDLLAGSKP